ncbi:hypothetical protein LUZ60_002550 [Juncus effusus]|nr:hypothetical protein LUZ60_002550 [Juncus effusus]
MCWSNGRIGWKKLPQVNSSDPLIQALFDPLETVDSDEDFNIDLRKLKIDSPYSHGAFGKLYTGTYDGLDVSIKLLSRPEYDTEKAHLMEQEFEREILILSNLNHLNFMKFMGACRKSSVWCIVMEHPKHNSIRDFVRKNKRKKKIPLKIAVRLALDVAKGMAYLHNLGFIHADLRSTNLIIMPDKSVKIVGFEILQIELKPEKMTAENTTYRWMAPEMIQHRSYNQKADVYSFGIVLWELVTGKLPFENMTAVQAAYVIVNNGTRPIVPHDCPYMLREIMTRCWDSDPDSRPEFTEVIRMLECTLIKEGCNENQDLLIHVSFKPQSLFYMSNTTRQFYPHSKMKLNMAISFDTCKIHFSLTGLLSATR